MKWTENIDAHISAFEQERWETIKPKVVELIKAVGGAGDYFEALGKEDASSGKTRRTKEAFIEWGKRELSGSEGLDNPVVDLMYMCYLDGFEKAEVVHEG